MTKLDRSFIFALFVDFERETRPPFGSSRVERVTLVWIFQLSAKRREKRRTEKSFLFFPWTTFRISHSLTLVVTISEEVLERKTFSFSAGSEMKFHSKILPFFKSGIVSLFSALLFSPLYPTASIRGDQLCHGYAKQQRKKKETP